MRTAAAATSKQDLCMTVEIHDVTPRFHDEVLEIHRKLRSLGVDQPTLLVVPAFEVRGQGRNWDLRKHPESARWLRHQQARGSEIVLHGLSHRAFARPPPGARAWLMHHGYSRGCAEFAHIGRQEAKRRLGAGQNIFEDCGLKTDGFIAPAWQQSPAAFDALRETGLQYTAFFGSVVDLKRDLRMKTPVLTFSAPGVLTDHAKRAFMRGRETWAAKTPLIRVALHPEDAQTPGRLEHIVRRVEVLLRRRRVVPYRDLIRPERGEYAR
ncbi:MAG: polysaccharide deacetylase family protein [Deltaproteobacteria bacterium]|nr:polysaccharide deacetylase family protein [Deltaproteobacteria bacterium]